MSLRKPREDITDQIPSSWNSTKPKVRSHSTFGNNLSYNY